MDYSAAILERLDQLVSLSSVTVAVLLVFTVFEILRRWMRK